MDNTKNDACFCKTCKENKGVVCDVTNCYYHDGESCCTEDPCEMFSRIPFPANQFTPRGCDGKKDNRCPCPPEPGCCGKG